MTAMVLPGAGQPLEQRELPVPQPRAGQVQVRVTACAVCRTDLHVVDGELTEPKLPLVLGHEIVGHVSKLGEQVEGLAHGQRVGIPWLGWSCGVCKFCRSGRENLCPRAQFTGYHIDGGYAQYTVADARYCFPLPGEDAFDDAHATPLLCAGLIGYRTLRMAGDAQRVGIYGFGAAAHVIAQLMQHEGRASYAFTREGDTAAQQFARELGAVWAGASTEAPPETLDAALIFAPVGELVPAALAAVDKGGAVVCGGIHMSDIPRFPYALLWQERSVRSVANLTRRDGEEFLRLAPEVPIRTHIQRFPLAQANEALHALRDGNLQGAAVLEPWAST